jgi:sulfatase maturation enzyme AslB (radical SAM superfamily)
MFAMPDQRPPLTSSFRRDPRVRYRFPQLARMGLTLKRLWRALRVLKGTHWLLGHQYQPSREQIEIDLTYLCNLRCNNCNRSSAQAPEALHLELDLLREFVSDSISQQRAWQRIRLLGGEPTLHPHFAEVFAILEPLRELSPTLIIEVVSNGHGEKVQRQLAKLPPHVSVENSEKQGIVQAHFGPFNLAPQDEWWHPLVDYRHGCCIPQQCGIGLTPTGYYPCAVAGGIDRVTGISKGRGRLPDTQDEMRDLMDRACRLCGRFRDGHFVPYNLRVPLLTQATSKSWQRIYTDWSMRQRGERVGAVE